MSGVLFSALLRAILVGVDVGTSGKPVNLVGDDGNGTGVPGICIVHFDATSNGAGQATSIISANVNCNGDTALWLSPYNPTVDTVWTFTDDRIGPITMSFRPGPGGNTRENLPWPGDPFLQQNTYTESANFEVSNKVGLFKLAPSTGIKSLTTTNCDGDKIQAIVGVQTADSSTDSGYAIAFPRPGQTVGCSS